MARVGLTAAERELEDLYFTPHVKPNGDSHSPKVHPRKSPIHPVSDTFAARIKARRLELTLTIRDAASLANMHYQGWQIVEGGYVDMSLAKAHTMAQALGTTLDTLLSTTEVPTNG